MAHGSILVRLKMPRRASHYGDTLEVASIQIYTGGDWETLERALATTENHEVDMFDFPLGGVTDLYSDSASTYGNYFDIWERIRSKRENAAEIALLDRAVLFARTRLNFGRSWEPRLELPLTPTPMHDGDVYIDNPWSFLVCALNPQSVRESCQAGQKFQVENYREQFYTLGDRGLLFEDCDVDNPAEHFENFQSYHDSWQVCLAESECENCGLLVFCW